MHGSYEDRPGAEDPVLACLDDDAYELQVEAWTRELERAGAAEADLLYLHHLTPLNEAAARAFPDLPVLGHVHGTELLMLERIAAGAPPGWTHAEELARRLCEWAAACERIVVNNAGGLERAARVLDLEPERFVAVPNGFDPTFAPGAIDRAAHWRRAPGRASPGLAPGRGGRQRRLRGRRPGGARRHGPALRRPLHRGQAPAAADRGLRPGAPALRRPRVPGPARRPPRRVGGRAPVRDDRAPRRPRRLPRRLALPRRPARLPHASDVLVHASVNEQFGQVLVEAMACELPTIAVDRAGPATIVDDPDTGWLVEPDDAEALAAAMVAAVNDPAGAAAAAAAPAARRSAATPGRPSATTSPSSPTACSTALPPAAERPSPSPQAGPEGGAIRM